jgi:ABC-2 type transport system permease protein
VEKKRKNSGDLNNLITLLAIIVLLNYVGSFVFHRFDLTSEKRYSLSEQTITTAENLEDVVYFKIYLESKDFTPELKRLRDATYEMMEELKAYGGSNIEYEFIDPNENPDQNSRDEFHRQLYEKGLRPTDLQTVDEDGQSRKTIWPWAILSYRGKELPVELLQSQLGGVAESMINSSIENLEYELANGIKTISSGHVKIIGFIEGHGELDKYETGDIANELSKFYRVDRVSIDGRLSQLTERIIDSASTYVKNKYDLIIIAKPDSAFTEKDKFIIDQHIMYGGKVLWLIDPVFASMDSLMGENITMAIRQETNLDDQLFKYGARINANLIQDLQSTKIPVVAGFSGNQPQYKFFNWYFFPLLNSTQHPISKNLNLTKGEFTSTIDTVGSSEIKKTILLTTSAKTKTVNTPTRISLGILRFDPNPAQFNEPNQSVAVLLEGKFESVFNGRIPDNIENSKEIKFKPKSDDNKMIVISDGDIIKNFVNRETKQIMPLGYDRYTREFYGNKDFIMNCINYLCEDSGMMTARNRSFKIRLLDKVKVKAEKTKWQFINTIIPLLLLVAFGFIWNFIRKKKFTK